MPDVVDLIMADHREVERLFDVLQKEPDQRPIAGPTVTALLIAHSRAEEAEVYPVARDEAGETEEVEHSQEEHAEAEELLERLQATDPTSSQYEQILQKVVDSVTHHVEDEEKTVLPGMRERLSDQRRAELGEAFARARAEHLGDLPGEATREELVLQAKNSGIKNAGNMTKAELKRRLQP
ncbi:hemerythrin domain-containing protein [Flindersiella endophytica]